MDTLSVVLEGLSILAIVALVIVIDKTQRWDPKIFHSRTDYERNDPRKGKRDL